MRTRPRVPGGNAHGGRQRKKAEDKETRARTRTLPGVTYPGKRPLPTVLLRGDKFSTGKSSSSSSYIREMSRLSQPSPRIKLAASLLAGEKRGKKNMNSRDSRIYGSTARFGLSAPDSLPLSFSLSLPLLFENCQREQPTRDYSLQEHTYSLSSKSVVGVNL